MLIVFGALKIELNNIIRRTRILENMRIDSVSLYRGIHKDRDLLFVVTGMGKNNAKKAVDISLNQEQVKKAENIEVLITGFCGGASPDLKVGDLVTYSKVLDLSHPDGNADKEEKLGSNNHKFFDLPARKIAGIRAVVCGCTDHVVSTPAEKKILFDKYGADVIDMESYWLIDELIKKGVPSDRIWGIRVVSDDFRGRLPQYFSADNTGKAIVGFIKSSFLSIFSQKERRKNFYALNGIRKAKSRLNLDILD